MSIIKLYFQKEKIVPFKYKDKFLQFDTGEKAEVSV